MTSQSPTNLPPGISSDLLIEPSYAIDRGWSISCIEDRLTLKQLSSLIGAQGTKQEVYACFSIDASNKVMALNPDPKSVSSFLAEMVGGDVCIYDSPSTFIMTVLEGDITILAAAPQTFPKGLGGAMNRRRWLEVTSHLRNDLKVRLLSKYARFSP